MASLTITVKPKTMELLIAYLRKTYYQRIGVLQKKRDHADIELKKLYEFRQALIEKNLSGVYSDDVFKEQNKLLEEKIRDIQVTKNDALLSKYNLEAITAFIKGKFTNLVEMYSSLDLEAKRVLLCSIFPLGVLWSYPGYSNTEISPYYQAILALEKDSVAFSAESRNRTRITCSSDKRLDQLGNLGPFVALLLRASKRSKNKQVCCALSISVCLH